MRKGRVLYVVGVNNVKWQLGRVGVPLAYDVMTADAAAYPQSSGQNDV
jgi:hypothetical protein